MKKAQIIKKEKEFTDIIKNYPYKKNNYFVIYYKKTNEHNRYGISVPKKTGKANVRNKIKRRVKSIIDNNEKEVQSHYDYVIIIRKRLIELNYQEIEYNLINLFNRIGEQNEKKNKS